MHGPVFLPASLADIPDIAVAVCRHNSNFHTAIFYRDSQGKLNRLELFIGGQIGTVPVDHTKKNWFAWAVPRIPPELRDSVRELCEQIGKKPPEVYYGLKYAPSQFYTEGNSWKVGLGGDTVGFTCATFVLALFDSLGLSLIQHGTWEHRTEDDAEQAALVVYASQSVPPNRPYGIAQHVMQRNAADVPCVRYRCQEVLASCILNRPSAFRETEAAGLHVRRWIIASEDRQHGREPHLT